MSVWKMIASDYTIPEVRPQTEYPLEINLDEGTVFDGNADDNFFLLQFLDDMSEYSDLKQGVTLAWNYYTEGRAKRIIEIINDTLHHTERVELWNFWLGYLEYERPIIKTITIPIGELSPIEIEKWDKQEVWNSPARPGDRPHFYCLRIIR
jgi:hypothetical protein